MCVPQVYAIAFNTPYGDRVATGSFDKTARLWDVNSGQCCQQLRGTQGVTLAELLLFLLSLVRVSAGSW